VGARARPDRRPDVSVETVELDGVWESSGDALATIAGTPYGPILAGLPSTEREAVLADFGERLGAGHRVR